MNSFQNCEFISLFVRGSDCKAYDIKQVRKCNGFFFILIYIQLKRKLPVCAIVSCKLICKFKASDHGSGILVKQK